MKAYWSGLFNAKQAQNYMASFSVEEPLPKAGKCLWIAPPIGTGDTTCITKTTLKGTDRKLLYRIDLFRA